MRNWIITISVASLFILGGAVVTKSAKIATVQQVTLKTTAGDLVIELNKETPITSKNFSDLVKKGFYDGVIFHRVIKGFMIQGGDPTGTGTGGPGYKFADEKFSGKYLRGTVAMANSGPNTNGSQFFIMHADYPLPPNYTIFGKLISGFETLDKIATAPTDSSDRPIDPIKIISADKFLDQTLTLPVLDHIKPINDNCPLGYVNYGMPFNDCVTQEYYDSCFKTHTRNCPI